MGNRNSISVKVPIDVIKQKVSIASNISIEELELPNKWPGARKRERVDARNISMALAKDMSGMSLSTIGMHHGGRDHATVLHAHGTIENLIDTKNTQITELYKLSQNLIQEWTNRKNPLFKKRLSNKEKNDLVKTWIKNHVPLYVRQRILDSVGKRCSECGNINNNLNHGHRTKTLSNSLQRSYKK